MVEQNLRALVIAELRAGAEAWAEQGRNAVPGFCGTKQTYENGVTTPLEPFGLYDEPRALAAAVRIFRRMLDAAEGVELYRPSNGSEGEHFMMAWCARCTKDAAFRANPDDADGCPIIAETMAFDIDEPGYPREWRQDGPDGPRCTAYEARHAL